MLTVKAPLPAVVTGCESVTAAPPVVVRRMSPPAPVVLRPLPVLMAPAETIVSGPPEELTSPVPSPSCKAFASLRYTAPPAVTRSTPTSVSIAPAPAAPIPPLAVSSSTLVLPTAPSLLGSATSVIDPPPAVIAIGPFPAASTTPTSTPAPPITVTAAPAWLVASPITLTSPPPSTVTGSVKVALVTVTSPDVLLPTVIELNPSTSSPISTPCRSNSVPTAPIDTSLPAVNGWITSAPPVELTPAPSVTVSAVIVTAPLPLLTNALVSTPPVPASSVTAPVPSAATGALSVIVPPATSDMYPLDPESSPFTHRLATVTAFSSLTSMYPPARAARLSTAVSISMFPPTSRHSDVPLIVPLDTRLPVDPVISDNRYVAMFTSPIVMSAPVDTAPASVVSSTLFPPSAVVPISTGIPAACTTPSSVVVPAVLTSPKGNLSTSAGSFPRLTPPVFRNVVAVSITVPLPYSLTAYPRACVASASTVTVPLNVTVPVDPATSS